MSVSLFSCGHARTVDNTVSEQGRTRCITCKRARAREAYSDDPDIRHLEYRQRYLPIALERTRAKLIELENEARRYGMKELLTNPVHLDRAWDRMVVEAQVETEAKGGSIGFGEALR